MEKFKNSCYYTFQFQVSYKPCHRHLQKSVNSLQGSPQHVCRVTKHVTDILNAVLFNQYVIYLLITHVFQILWQVVHSWMIAIQNCARRYNMYKTPNKLANSKVLTKLQILNFTMDFITLVKRHMYISFRSIPSVCHCSLYYCSFPRNMPSACVC